MRSSRSSLSDGKYSNIKQQFNRTKTFFSTKIVSFSSDTSLSRPIDNDDVDGIPVIFKPRFSGLTRSQIRVSPPKLKVESTTSIVDPKDYICRICLGGNSTGDLLQPCQCKGSIALAHLKCLEIWLNESNRNTCELCQYRFKIVREPKYGLFQSIFIFFKSPGEHGWELFIDIITLAVYTPSTVTSTYMLMLLCESIAKSELKFRQNILSHLMAFTAIFGIAAINFTYTSWLVLTIEKYVDLWREWYRRNGTLKLVLSEHKLIPLMKKRSDVSVGSE